MNERNFYCYYHIIFIKNLSSNEIKKILEKIEDLSLEDTLNKLNKKEKVIK